MKQITKFIACTLSLGVAFAIACKKENNTTTSEENKPPVAKLSIINGSTLLAYIGSLSEAKDVVPATAGNKVVFAGGYVEQHTVGYSPTASVDIYQFSTNTWSKATLSQTRSGITTATVGNKILYAGGHGKNNFSTRVDVYNAEASTWSTAELSIGRNNIVTAVTGNKAFFAGGWDTSGITTRVDIYDAATNTWSTAELSDKRLGFSAITLGDKVFFAGGYRDYDWDDVPINFSTRVDIYDMATNQWSTAELSEASYGMATATVGNKVFFSGGYTSADGPSNRVDIYDVATNTWSTTTLSEPRASIKAVTVGNKVVFAGGYNKQGTTATVDIYDASSNSWSTALLSQSRNISSTATLGNKVLFFTGGYPNTNQIDIYDASAGTWSDATFDKGIYSFAIAAGNQVYFGGGSIHTQGTNKLTSGVWKLQF